MRAYPKVAAILLLVAAQAAQAHVGVQPASAQAGSVETLSFIVGHGCDGQATTALRVELPASLSAIEPQAKIGWRESVERLSDDAVAVTWRGELPPHQTDGFLIRAKLPATPGRLAFKVAQSCGAVIVLWDEVAAPDGPRASHPIPSMTLTTGVTVPSAEAPRPERLPEGVQRLADGGLSDSRGRALYTYAKDQPGQRPAGEEASNWKRAK